MKKKKINLFAEKKPLGGGDRVLIESSGSLYRAGIDKIAEFAGLLPSNISEFFYGIEWDDNVANPACTRIGRAELHASLPIQSKMRRCLLSDTGQVNAYLHPTDSTRLDTGGVANLSGAAGQVMVEIPEHYRKFEKEGTKNRCLISEMALPGFHFVPKAYRSAYEATVQRGVNKLASVVNSTPEFRGGDNNVAWDGTYRTLIGRPATSISLLNFRSYARNRGNAGVNGAGWNCDLYELQKTCYWLYAIEYANFNSQSPYNAAPDANGYKQGGLGDGVTTLSSAHWSTFNGYFPFVPCGHTNSLGNRTGVVPYSLPAEFPTALTVQVPTYRGVENPFGHVWHWTDGCLVKANSDNDGGLREFYANSDPATFSSGDITNYTKRGDLPTSDGYIRTMMTGEYGENMPAGIGGGTTTYFCDYYYTDAKPASGFNVRGVLFGGNAHYGAGAGLACSNTAYAVAYTSAGIGSRLCFIP